MLLRNKSQSGHWLPLIFNGLISELGGIDNGDVVIVGAAGKFQEFLECHQCY